MREGVTDLWVGTFAARSDAYVSGSRRHVNEPLTPALIEQALTDDNALSVSGYMANDFHHTHVAAIDFDNATFEEVLAVDHTLYQFGIKPLIVGSRRGAHLWMLFSEVGIAAVVRKALIHAINLTDTTLIDRCEIFPKRSEASFGAGALRMPLMVHPKTGIRYPAFDDSGMPLTSPEEVLMAFDTTDWLALAKLVSTIPASTVQYPRGLGAYRRPTNADGGSAVQMLEALGVHARVGHGARCPFHDDTHASLSVASDDQRVWCKAPECVAHNGGRGLGTFGMAALIRKMKP